MEKTVVLQNTGGFHARPAALFVRQAGQYQADVIVEANGRRANGKSILNLIALGVTHGQSIKIMTDGIDANEALEHLADLINDRFGEA